MRWILIAFMFSCGGTEMPDSDACEALKQCQLDIIVECGTTHRDDDGCLDDMLPECSELQEACDESRARLSL